MKAILACLTLFVLFGAGVPIKDPNLPASSEFKCVLSVDKARYKLGDSPAFKVEIINNSTQDIYLIGSLDASDLQWRMPYCAFEIEKVGGEFKQNGFGRCGNMNGLRPKDFVEVKAGETFDPYGIVDGYGFFSTYLFGNITEEEDAGTYNVRFHYSTNSSDVEDFKGDYIQSDEVYELFERLPQIELTSNTVQFKYVK